MRVLSVNLYNQQHVQHKGKSTKTFKKLIKAPTVQVLGGAILGSASMSGTASLTSSGTIGIVFGAIYGLLAGACIAFGFVNKE